MWKKLKLLAVAALAAGAIGWFGTAAANAEPRYEGYEEPEGLRIPGEIELLENTAYYASLWDTEPEGMFAPQKVKVIRAQSTWSTGSVTWEIETMYGPRWIRPAPWSIDIAPPKTVMLLEETPLYPEKDERSSPAASLSPQEVQVTGAEKKWFYTNDPDSKTWIRVHTTWLGDLWAHIPLNRIGTVEETNRKAHLGVELPPRSLGDVMGVVSTDLAAQAPAAEYLAGDYTIDRIYTTIYDKAFRVDTGRGFTWTRHGGTRIWEIHEAIPVKGEKLLVRDLWDNKYEESALIKNETVTAFEKITDPLWRPGRFSGPPPVWVGGTWYHVRTSKGTGWMNPSLGEPDTAVPVRWKVQIRGPKELHRYPGVVFDQTSLMLRNQTVEVKAYWDDAGGNKWLKTSSEGREGWIPSSWIEDRIWDQERGTALQITQDGSQGVGIMITAGRLKLYDDRFIGRVENGVYYLDPLVLGGQLQYKTEIPAYSDRAALFAKGDYSLRLEADSPSASIYWKGNLEKTFPLLEAPQITEEGWLLRLEDIRNLFGLSQGEPGYDYLYLFENQYNVELSPGMLTGKNGTFHLSGFLYDWGYVAERSIRTPMRLSAGIPGGDRQQEGTETAVASSGASLKQLYRLDVSLPLPAGSRKVEAALRAGERIIWKQSLLVEAE